VRGESPLRRRLYLVLSVAALAGAACLSGCGGESADPAEAVSAVGGSAPGGSAPDRTGLPVDPKPPEGTFATLELEATFSIWFGFLNGVRELADGTVLAADPLAQVLFKIDMGSGTADTIGGVGPGPQEYKQPDRVFPLPADSSLLVDFGKTQLTVVHPDGTFGSGLPMVLPRESGFPDLIQPQFVDAEGNLYHQAGRSRDAGPPDSAALVRIDRSTFRHDTVGMVWLPEYRPRRSRRNGFLPKMLEARDDWAVAMNGDVAIVRAAGFSVEWIRADGTRVVGPEHTFETQRVSQHDKESILAETRSSGISMRSAVSQSGDVSSMSMSRGLPDTGDGPGVEDFEWAEEFPLFRPDRSAVSPEGKLWVQRWLPTDAPTRWEVFDDAGAWVGSVELPPGYQLLGFGTTADGENAAYLARTDEYDLKWLERFRVIR